MKQSNFMKIYIYPLLFISPFMTMSCNSWFSMWMMMELNMLNFIPMIIFTNKYFKDLSFKYFIIQTISSSILILMSNSILLNLNKNFLWISMMMNLSLLMKLGFPPFHLWFVNMMNNMTWLNCLILSTWQKIIPMIMMMLIYNKMMIMMLLIMATFMSTTMNLNHQSLRIIFSYSSINHMSWMLLNLLISEIIWMMYFILYTIINSSLMLMMNLYKIYYINQMFIINQFKNNKMIMFMNLISICGLPPMFGFNMKWVSIHFFTMNNLYMLNFIMILLTIFNFIFYTRIILSFLTLSMLKNKLLLMNKFNTKNLCIVVFIVSFMNLWLISMWMY